LGRLEFDPQTACFIARDTVLVLDRIGDLLSVLDPSDRLRMWLEAREAEETGRRHLKRERGHLRLGRVPELLRNAHEALLSVPPGDEQRGALRQPLLNLRNEIDRIQGNPSVPREKKQSPYY